MNVRGGDLLAYSTWGANKRPQGSPMRQRYAAPGLKRPTNLRVMREIL